MRIFKNTWFSRFADKEGITDGELVEAVNLLEAGQANDLGGGVYKMRLARPGEGKRGGYRVIVFFKYCFSKSNRDNINEKDLRDFKIRARNYLSMTDEQIEWNKKIRTFIEVL
jgi:hypothetical protein